METENGEVKLRDDLLLVPDPPRPEKPTAIVNILFPDGTSGDFCEGWETWSEFLRRKGMLETPDGILPLAWLEQT